MEKMPFNVRNLWFDPEEFVRHIFPPEMSRKLKDGNVLIRENEFREKE